LATIAGTPYYMAPEVQDGEKTHYDCQVDCWSMGVLLYVFMCGYLPFQAENRSEVFMKIKRAQYHFDHEEFKSCSQEVKDLISKLLVVDPSVRLSAS
jgi:calcium/calmodulin-dependent protein kinase I